MEDCVYASSPHPHAGVTCHILSSIMCCAVQVVDAEAALKAGMAKVSELESKAAAAPEPVRALLHGKAVLSACSSTC